MTQQSAVEQWREHNESFQYEPPDEEPEAWSAEQYDELHDRIIGRQVTWTCEKCSKPFPSLDRARRHVRTKHSEELLESVRRKQDGGRA